MPFQQEIWNENVVNAKCLFQSLLEKTHDLCKPWVDAEITAPIIHDTQTTQNDSTVVDAETTMAANIPQLPEMKRKETAKAMALLHTAPIIHDTEIGENDSTEVDAEVTTAATIPPLPEPGRKKKQQM